MEEKMIYDAAIIGTGPAGISAAITLKIRSKNVLLLGSRNLSSKVEKAHLIQNYPGLPSITGVNFGKPYEGEEEFLGRGVSYCATCSRRKGS